MVYQPKILAFAGSLRRDSFNKKLLKAAVKGAEAAGASVTVIDLKDYPLPVYDQDIEDQAMPENALKVKELMAQADGFLIASPEYNSSMSAALKNVVDWASRKASADEPFLYCFNDKVVALLSASRGNLGGMRGLFHVRSMFGNINTLVLPQQKCLSGAPEAFDEQGNLKDPKHEQETQNIGKALADFLKKHKS